MTEQDLARRVAERIAELKLYLAGMGLLGELAPKPEQPSGSVSSRAKGARSSRTVQ